MWPFTKRKPLPPVDLAAAKAFKAGRTIYIRRIGRVPGDITGKHMAMAIQRIEAAGYRMEHQRHGGQGFQQWVEVTFRAVTLDLHRP
jgi:hypothetical protein